MPDYSEAEQKTSLPLWLYQFIDVFDERFEAYHQGNKAKTVLRDCLGAVIVALVAIPLGVGFAIASGLRPEQGIAAGALACLLGGIFGGSKFQIYGPTAAFITIVAGIVRDFDVPFLLLATVIAGIVVLIMGLGGLGKYFKMVPHSVIVGFTMGIAATIVVTQLPDAFGMHDNLKSAHHTWEKILHVPGYFAQANGHALVLGMITFFIIRQLYKISIYIPAPLIAIVVGAVIANFVWDDYFIPLISTKYGDMAGNLFTFTLPSLGNHSVADLIVPVISIVFIAALESLLSARMADRLAENQTPYNPNKELFGQGLINMVVPLFNGFPCTGALARTATSIKVGSMSPLAAILKSVCMVGMMAFLAGYLSLLPMACIGGLLIYVAFNMVKPSEVQEVLESGKFHTFLMLFTAVMTIATDLMIAVGAATALYYLLKPFFLRPQVLQAKHAVVIHSLESQEQGERSTVKAESL